MARYSSKDVAFILLDGMDIRPQVFEMDALSREAILEETDAFGATDEEWSPTGMKRAEGFKLRGFYDDAANSINVAFVGLAQRVLNIGFESNLEGRKCVGYGGAITSVYRRQASRASLHKAEGQIMPAGPLEDGVILHRLVTETADPYISGSPHDNGASSANGASAYLQMTALVLGGFTNIIFKARHSTDNSVYVDLITFTAITTGAVGVGQRLAVAGTINRYVRTEYDFTGAGGGQSVTFMMAFMRAA